MQFFEIEDTKKFMAALLTKENFRDFELSSAQITTFMTITLDGLLHRDYYSADTLPDCLNEQGEQDRPGEQEKPEIAEGRGAEGGAGQNRLVPWMLAQPVILGMIRGKDTPLSMKLVLRLADGHTNSLASRTALTFAPSDIRGLFLNISYEQGKLTCTTGTSLAVFTTDKSLEHLWDEAAGRFLDRL